jgi:hypothetical protein
VTGGDGHGGRDSGETGAQGAPHAALGARGRSMDGAQRFGDSRRLGLKLGGVGVHGGRRGEDGRLGLARTGAGSNLK